MLNGRWLNSILVLVLVLASSSAGAVTPESEQRPLSGVVTSEKDTPLGGTIVRARHLESGISTSVVTDQRGKFFVPELKKGEYELRAEKKGYRPSDAKKIRVDDGLIRDVSFALNSLPATPVSQLTSAEIIAQFPEGAGKIMVAGSCGACHGLSTVFAKGGRSSSEWEQVVKRMRDVPGGYIQINDRNTPPILEYLSKFLGSGSTLPQEISAKVKKAHPEKLPLGHDIVYREYDVPTPLSEPHTAVPDGRGSVWFSEFGARKIGRLNVETGKITEYPLKTPNSNPHGLTVAPDGVVWFPAFTFVLGRIDPKTDTHEEFRVPDREDGKAPGPHSIVVAKNGIVWFTEQSGSPGSISSFDPTNRQFHRYLMEPGSSPYGIIEHNGMIWFTLVRPGKVGVLNPKSGQIQTFAIPTKDSAARRLRFDARERLWFGEYGTDKIGVFDPSSKEFSEYGLPFRGSPYSLHVDQKGHVWVACFDRDSLIRFDPETKEMREYPLPGVGVIIRDIWSDRDGRMWFMQWGRNKVTSAEMIQSAAK